MPSAPNLRRRANVVSATAGVPVAQSGDSDLRVSITDFVDNDVINGDNVEKLLEEFPPLDPKVAMKTMRELHEGDIGAEEVVNRILDCRTDHAEILAWIQAQHGPKQIVIVLNLHGDDATIPEDEQEEYPTIEAYWKSVVESNIDFDHSNSGVESITSRPIVGS